MEHTFILFFVPLQIRWGSVTNELMFRCKWVDVLLASSDCLVPFGSLLYSIPLTAQGPSSNSSIPFMKILYSFRLTAQGPSSNKSAPYDIILCIFRSIHSEWQRQTSTGEDIQQRHTTQVPKDVNSFSWNHELHELHELLSSDMRIINELHEFFCGTLRRCRKT